MRRFLMIATLLITLCNVGAVVAYACKCYEKGDPNPACETSGSGHCYRDAGGKCHCVDAEEDSGDAGGEEEALN